MDIKRNMKAFTLVELLIVIIIIGILTGVIALSFSNSDAKAKETACLGNRKTIETAWHMYNFANGTTETLQAFIDAHYHDQISNNKASCPSDGLYSAQQPEGRLVACSVHSGGGAGNSGGAASDSHFLYNTNEIIPIPDGNCWASMSDFENFYKTSDVDFLKGTLIQIGKDCYIALGPVKNKAAQSNTPAMYFNEGAFVKIPSSQSVPVKWTQNSGTYGKGDLCEYNGKYYIAAYPISTNETQYYRLNPEENADKTAWIALQ